MAALFAFVVNPPSVAWQRGLLQVGRHADDGIDERGGKGDAQRRTHPGLQVKMLWIDADGCETSEYAPGSAADGCGDDAFDPQFKLFQF